MLLGYLYRKFQIIDGVSCDLQGSWMCLPLVARLGLPIEIPGRLETQS